MPLNMEDDLASTVVLKHYVGWGPLEIREKRFEDVKPAYGYLWLGVPIDIKEVRVIHTGFPPGEDGLVCIWANDESALSQVSYYSEKTGSWCDTDGWIYTWNDEWVQFSWAWNGQILGPWEFYFANTAGFYKYDIGEEYAIYCGGDSRMISEPIRVAEWDNIEIYGTYAIGVGGMTIGILRISELDVTNWTENDLLFKINISEEDFEKAGEEGMDIRIPIHIPEEEGGSVFDYRVGIIVQSAPNPIETVLKFRNMYCTRNLTIGTKAEANEWEEIK